MGMTRNRIAAGVLLWLQSVALWWGVSPHGTKDSWCTWWMSTTRCQKQLKPLMGGWCTDWSNYKQVNSWLLMCMGDLVRESFLDQFVDLTGVSCTRLRGIKNSSKKPWNWPLPGPLKNAACIVAPLLVANWFIRRLAKARHIGLHLKQHLGLSQMGAFQIHGWGFLASTYQWFWLIGYTWSI